MNSDEADALNSHGFKSSALGDNCPTWLKKFAAMQVRSRHVGAMRYFLTQAVFGSRRSRELE